MTVQTAGQLDPSDIVSEYAEFVFKVQRILARVRTVTWVKVVSFTANANPLIPGVVKVQPIINLLDGNGNASQHGQISNIPVARFQGGNNALIIDPVAGDVGMLLVSDRDVSAAQAANGAISNPGSFRRFDLADGVYFGGLFGAAPTQYLRFTPTGLVLLDASGNQIQTSSSGINITPKTGQPVTITGSEIVTGDETIDGNLHVEGTLTVDGAAQVLSLMIASGAKITRLLTGSISTAGGVNSGTQTLIGTASIPGTKAGDLVLLSNWSAASTCFIQPVSVNNGVNILVTNPTPVNQGVAVSTAILVIGTTP